MFRLFVSRTTARRPRRVSPELEALEQVLSLSSLTCTRGSEVIMRGDNTPGTSTVSRSIVVEKLGPDASAFGKKG
jgi:hypothetical protein